MPRVRAFIRIGEKPLGTAESKEIYLGGFVEEGVERGRDGRFIRNRGVAFLGTLGTRSPLPPGFGRRQDRW